MFFWYHRVDFNLDSSEQPQPLINYHVTPEPVRNQMYSVKIPHTEQALRTWDSKNQEAVQRTWYLLNSVSPMSRQVSKSQNQQWAFLLWATEISPRRMRNAAKFPFHVKPNGSEKGNIAQFSPTIRLGFYGIMVITSYLPAYL